MTDTLEDLTDTHLTELLEDDYRRQLRWYPKPWRAAHGEALIGTLLDEADDNDRFTMEPGEWRSFAAAGLAARLDRIVMRPVRDAAATVLLSAGAGLSLVSSVISSWAPWGTGPSDFSPAFGPFYDAGPILTALWVIALVSALAGRWWVGRGALVVSILVSIFMHQAEIQVAPAHFLSLDPGTLTLSATGAFLALLGTPRTRLPLVSASAGWAGLGCIAHAFLQQRVDAAPNDRPTGLLLLDSAGTSWALALALGVAVIFALARYRIIAFTIVLAVVPVTAAVDASQIAFPYNPPASYLLIIAPVAAGLVLLVRVSRRTVDDRGSTDRTAATPTRRRRRSAIGVAVLAPLLVLGGAATALTISGLNWANPAGVNWSEYWKVTARPSTDVPHPVADLTYRLPGGGSCAIRVGVTDLTGNTPPARAARLARNYLTVASRDGALLTDAHVGEMIRQNVSAQNSWTNFWGVQVAYGRGTSNYNADVEYYEAVDAGIRQAIKQQIERAGASTNDAAIDTAQRCSGEQQ